MVDMLGSVWEAALCSRRVEHDSIHPPTHPPPIHPPIHSSLHPCLFIIRIMRDARDNPIGHQLNVIHLNLLNCFEMKTHRAPSSLTLCYHVQVLYGFLDNRRPDVKNQRELHLRLLQFREVSRRRHLFDCLGPCQTTWRPFNADFDE